MSAPVDTKAGVKAKRPLRAAKPTTELGADQMRLLRLFSAMDQTRQEHMLIIAEGFVESFPRAATPSLRLIAGGVR
jgi:hypothetical protein